MTEERGFTYEARRAFWRAHVDAWLASGISQYAYCDEQELPRRSFLRWRVRFRDEADTARRQAIARRGGRPSARPITLAEERQMRGRIRRAR